MKLLITFLLFGPMTFGQTSEVKLFEFKSSTCDQKEDPYKLRTRIISQTLKGNLLEVHLAASATCCVDFEPKILVNAGILYLDIKETGSPCECRCCYEFTYRVEGIRNSKIKIKFRGKDIELSKEKYLD